MTFFGGGCNYKEGWEESRDLVLWFIYNPHIIIFLVTALIIYFIGGYYIQMWIEKRKNDERKIKS